MTAASSLALSPCNSDNNGAAAFPLKKATRSSCSFALKGFVATGSVAQPESESSRSPSAAAGESAEVSELGAPDRYRRRYVLLSNVFAMAEWRCVNSTNNCKQRDATSDFEAVAASRDAPVRAVVLPVESSSMVRKCKSISACIQVMWNWKCGEPVDGLSSELKKDNKAGSNGAPMEATTTGTSRTGT